MDPATSAGVGAAITKITPEAVAAAKGVFGRLCNPALEELGLLLRDNVVAWRAMNAVRLAEKTKARLQAKGEQPGDVHVHPRLAIMVINQASWTDDDVLQDMWSGLLVSAATPDGRDESNLIFTDLLGRVTAAQARVVAFMCEKAEKSRTRSDLILATAAVIVPVEGAMKIAQLGDIQQLDRELDHLRALGLTEGGMLVSESGVATDPPPPVNLTPTSLALQMYARCQGARDPLAFYGLTNEAPVQVVSTGAFGGTRSIVIRSSTKEEGQK